MVMPLENLKIRAKEWLMPKCVGCGKNIFVAFVSPNFVVEEPRLACSEECVKKYNDGEMAHLELRSRE